MRYKFLPKKYRTSHEYAFYLHDLLASTVTTGEKAGMFIVRFKLKSRNEADAMSSLGGEDLWKWLDDNGYRSITTELAYKQVIVALLADLCHFIYEALSCSVKCKLTVAYALLRKPLKDNLFYLEWLLADPQDFMRTFHTSPEKTAVDSVCEERKIDIIRGAIIKTRFPGWISADFLYDLRYRKTVSYGFEGLWNKATHLVTTCKSYATEQMNLNFVFSGDEEHLYQWNHFYNLVPLILYHAVEVVDALMSTITGWKEDDHNLEIVRRLAGFTLWTEDVQTENEGIPPIKLVQEMMNGVQPDCPACSSKIKFGKRNLGSFYRRGEFTCTNCHARISIGAPKGVE